MNTWKALHLISALILVTVPMQLSAQNYPDPTRFEETIQGFEQQDRLNPPPEGP